MAIQASIKIEFSRFYEDQVIIRFIQMLLDGGWAFNNEDKVSYLPIGYKDISDWIMDADISPNELMGILTEKDHQKEPVGIVLTWHNANIGGDFHISF
jgi:hypothetical protein